ncbi:MAG: mercuric transport protein MerTP [Cyclobacteriaceae bacterium]|nr:mercuric transport protein MerTP [Cyclobacteriaceae bacterium]
MKTENQKGMVLGVAAAVAASLCCITPVLALLGGISGIASSFSWIEPYRPYLIASTVAVFGFAWYQQLKPRKKDEIGCECETDEKPSFWQSKTFLSIITLFAALMVSFPHYAHIFYPKSPTTNFIIVEKGNIQQVEFKISGMDCEACSEHINHALDGVPGVLEHITSYEQGTSVVKFDASKTGKDKLVEAVNSTGYKVTETKTIEN